MYAGLPMPLVAAYVAIRPCVLPCLLPRVRLATHATLPCMLPLPCPCLSRIATRALPVHPAIYVDMTVAMPARHVAMHAARVHASDMLLPCVVLLPPGKVTTTCALKVSLGQHRKLCFARHLTFLIPVLPHALRKPVARCRRSCPQPFRLRPRSDARARLRRCAAQRCSRSPKAMRSVSPKAMCSRSRAAPMGLDGV